jgi:hypothetical protein
LEGWGDGAASASRWCGAATGLERSARRACALDRPPGHPRARAGAGCGPKREQKKNHPLSLFSPSLSPPRTRRVDDPVRPAHVAQPLKLGGQPGDGGQVVPLGAPVQDGLDLRREEGGEAKTGVSKAGGGARAAPSPPPSRRFCIRPPPPPPRPAHKSAHILQQDPLHAPVGVQGRL